MKIKKTKEKYLEEEYIVIEVQKKTGRRDAAYTSV